MAGYLLLDTSILCVYLRLPRFERCGPAEDEWDYQRVAQKIDTERQAGTSLVLPLATIIETGNHISQIKGHDILPFAQAFADILRDSVNEVTPWIAFSEQHNLWTDAELLHYAEHWPGQAVQKISLGDASIVRAANYLNQLDNVEIFTGDRGLWSLNPAPLSPRQRRRSNRR